jgi:hypothetical protein
MWRDIGLGDWLFDLDLAGDRQRVAPAVLAMAKDPESAKTKALRARQFVQQRQQESMAVLEKQLRAL